MRLIAGDDTAQAAIARSVLDQDFLLTATVLVETEWVLKSSYGFDRAHRAAALRMILDLPHAVDIPEYANWAVERLAEGADFADMMHLVTATGASSFATFDQSLAVDAGAAPPVPVETLN